MSTRMFSNVAVSVTCSRDADLRPDRATNIQLTGEDDIQLTGEE